MPYTKYQILEYEGRDAILRFHGLPLVVGG